MRIINHIALKVAPVDYVTPIIIEVNELRVVTTEQLADFYGCTAKQIKQNFNYNKKHFVEGKHYFKLEGGDLAAVKKTLEENHQEVENFYAQNFSSKAEENSSKITYLQVENFDSVDMKENHQNSQFAFKRKFGWYISPNTRSLYLWTKKGAARHCKMLGTEKAWEVFEMMEDAYFFVQELKRKEMFAGIEQKFPSTLSTNQLDRIERKIQELSDEVTNIKTYLKIVVQALS